MSVLVLNFALPGGRRIVVSVDRTPPAPKPIARVEPPRFDRLFGQAALPFDPPRSTQMPLPRGKRIR